MAKQLVSPVERHVEKVLLGIAVLALLGAVARYLISSPNQLELDGQTVTPKTIDDAIYTKAERIRQRIRDNAADVEPPEPLVREFEQTLALLDLEPWSLSAATGVDAPFVDEPGKVSGQFELLEVMRLAKPLATFGRSTFSVEDAAGEDSFYATNWVTVSSLVNVREQSKKQRLAYGATREELIYGPVEVQRRARTPDGTWPEAWQSVQPWFRYYPPPPPPQPELVQAEGRVEIKPESIRDLEEFENALTDPALQLELLRPIPPRVDNGSPWRFPIVTTALDVLFQDDELQYPNEPAATEPDDRYGFVRGGVVEDVEASKARQIAAMFVEAERLIKQARDTTNEDDARRAYNVYMNVIKDNQATPTDKAKAERGKAEAEQAEVDIRRKRRRPGGRNPTANVPQPGGGAAPVRETLPEQQVWLIDMTPGNVASGTVYQYRMRMTLFNRLAGDPGKFRDVKDATKVYIAGPWSEPSDPVAIPSDVEFYIATEDERDKEIGIRIFQWYEGVWVESRKFQVSVGDPVYGESRAPVPALDPNKPFDRAKVDFDAGAVVLDIDFDRPLRERKRGSGRDGVRFADRAKGVCAVAVVGPDGNVVERFVPIDKDNPSQRAAQSRTWQPPK